MWVWKFNPGGNVCACLFSFEGDAGLVDPEGEAGGGDLIVRRGSGFGLYAGGICSCVAGKADPYLYEWDLLDANGAFVLVGFANLFLV